MKKIYLCEEQFYGGFTASTREYVKLTAKEYLTHKKEQFAYDDGCYYQIELIRILFEEDKPYHKHGQILGRKPYDLKDKFEMQLKWINQKMMERLLGYYSERTYDQLKTEYNHIKNKLNKLILCENYDDMILPF